MMLGRQIGLNVEQKEKDDGLVGLRIGLQALAGEGGSGGRISFVGSRDDDACFEYRIDVQVVAANDARIGGRTEQQE